MFPYATAHMTREFSKILMGAYIFEEFDTDGTTVLDESIQHKAYISLQDFNKITKTHKNVTI